MTGVINSIQQVSITISAASTSNTATITSVNTSNAIIIYQGITTPNTATANFEQVYASIALTNATTVTATRGNSTSSVTVLATIIEFSTAVNSVQSGTISISAVSTSNTATITSVGANAFVLYLGANTATASTGGSSGSCSVVLTNSTTVTANVGAASSALTVGYMVADLSSTIINTVQARSITNATANTSYTDTITSVTTGNSILIWNGVTLSSAGGSIFNTSQRLDLTNATTVTNTRFATTTISRTTYYTVVQFQAAILNSNIQRGDIVLTTQTSNTATITSVNANLSFANWCNYNHATAQNGANLAMLSLTLTNGTTVTGNINGAGTSTVSYEVVEFAPSSTAFQALTEFPDLVQNINPMYYMIDNQMFIPIQIQITTPNLTAFIDNNDQMTSWS